MLFTDTTGNRTVFYGFTTAVGRALQGHLKSFIDAAGNLSVVTVDTANRLARVDRAASVKGAPVKESFIYDYATNGALNAVRREVSRSGVTSVVRKALYAYYTGAAGEFGEANQLNSVTIQDGTGSTIDQYHYRYWRAVDPGVQAVGMLRYVVNANTYARILATGSDPLAIANTAAGIGTWADKGYAYDNQGRVTSQVLHGAEIDGSSTQTYSYVNVAGRSDPNQWATKTVETLPDGTVNTVYCNAASQVMMRVTSNPAAAGKQWIDAFRYDAQGREIWHASPSAMTAFNTANGSTDEANADLRLTLPSPIVRSADGLITTTEYYPTTDSATGAVANYLKRQLVQKGQSDPAPTPIRLVTYVAHSGQ